MRKISRKIKERLEWEFGAVIIDIKYSSTTQYFDEELDKWLEYPKAKMYFKFNSEEIIRVLCLYKNCRGFYLSFKKRYEHINYARK